MNWQTPAALGVVAATAAIMAWRHWRPRKPGFAKATGCGCAGSSKPVGLVVRSRRGEAQRVEVVESPGARRGA